MARRLRTLSALLLLGIAAHAWSQGWPARAIKIIVPFPPGSSPDLVARILSDRLTAALHQSIIVENRPGAGGNLGTGLVAKAAPDGYTFGVSIPGPLAVNTVLYQKMEYNPFKDLAPVSLLAFSPNVLVVDPRLNIRNVQDLVELAKAQPGKLNYGSVGNGSASHLTMELLKQLTGADIVHVPYSGSPQVNYAILNGQIAAAFIVPATAMPLVQAGRLKAIGGTTAVRSTVLPSLPTIAEQGFPGFESTAWIAMVAPANTPRLVIDRMAQAVVAVLKQPEVRQRLHGLYFQAVGTAPEALANLMRSERDRWARVIKVTGAKVD
jgi:tripartite-type tricarboxylate transporter receptor subunit TctC